MDLRAEADALLTRVGVCVLADQGIVRVGGDDALDWLQGQITQDVSRLGVGESAFTLVLASTGKIRADAWVHRRESEVLLVVPASSAEALVAHLDAHVVMEDVELSVDPELAVVTVQGPEATKLRGERADALAADRLLVGAGFDVLVRRDEAEAAAAALAEAAKALGGARVGEQGFEQARIARGVPKLGADFGENTLPQEVGLAARAVSFLKGCYLGQEPVVMLEHRGQPPKRLFVVRAAGPLETGASLVAGGGEAVGRLTSIAPCPEPDGSYLGLALVKRAHASEGATLTSGATRVELVRPAGAPATDPANLP